MKDFVVENGVLVKYTGEGGDVTIPDGIISIGPNAFEYCNSLTGVTLSDSVTSVEDSAFFGCDKLIRVKLPNSLMSIGNYAFALCFRLTRVAIPKDVRNIGEHAFEFCDSLVHIRIPNGVISIGNSAFSWCSKLTDVIIPNSVISIGDSAFFDCHSMTEIAIPESVRSIGCSAFAYCQSLKYISVAKNNANYKDIDGNLYSKDGKTLLQYAAGKTETEFRVPDGVCVVGACSFDGAQSLTCIETPLSVVQIEDHAFSLCENLANLSILGPKTHISDLALEGRDNVIMLLTEDNNE